MRGVLLGLCLWCVFAGWLYFVNLRCAAVCMVGFDVSFGILGFVVSVVVADLTGWGLAVFWFVLGIGFVLRCWVSWLYCY